ncbi:MAG TPA: N-formylglutamate amidohydrolase, partial [Polyangiaceae bacterium LLY-WYZ-14_1]|nr:N-formylglutamate amidohydrolase [Polyangiaceae bacterium LLY-WYZ-14_1]
RERFGFAILLAAHSMPSVGRLGHLDTGARRADVVPGTRGRTTAHPALIDLVDRHFRSAGLTVRHDEPYRGGWTTSHYGRPHLGWHAIQIELNRALYVDEMTGEPRDGEFERLAALVTDLVEKLGAIDPR